MAIYGKFANELLESQVLQEKFKLFEFLKKKMPSKFKNNKKSEIDKDVEKFKQDYKLTPALLNSGFDIFSVIKSKEDFEKMIRATGTSNTKDTADLIFYTFCYAYDFPDSNTDFKGLIDTVKKDDRKNYAEYNKDAIKILTLASQNKLICISLDSDSDFYCLSDKNIYSVDYKGRVNGGESVDEYLDNYL